jgi:glycine cleavage system H protein
VREFLETSVDKFTFRVATDCLYTQYHVWVKWEDGLARIGLSDYLQQTSGDVAFADLEPEGTQLAPGDDLASIETIKANLALPSPVSGIIHQVNAALEDAPELINQDPYGEGWLALLEVTAWQTERDNLLDPVSYFEAMQAEIEKESEQL